MKYSKGLMVYCALMMSAPTLATEALPLVRLAPGECRAVEPARGPLTLCLAEGLRGESHGLCYGQTGDKVTVTWCAAGNAAAMASNGSAKTEPGRVVTPAPTTERVLIRRLARQGDVTEYLILREVLHDPIEDAAAATADDGEKAATSDAATGTGVSQGGLLEPPYKASADKHNTQGERIAP